MKRGFTILELLAASLLLSMLVTALTMIFNQSSIAWRTGVADVVDLEKTRAQLGIFHDIEDDALPGLGQTGETPGGRGAMKYRTVSIFRNWNGENNFQANEASDKVSGRLYDNIVWTTTKGSISVIDDNKAWVGGKIDLEKGSSKGGVAYIVGVESAGPDRDFGTKDDNISTLPEESQ